MPALSLTMPCPVDRRPWRLAGAALGAVAGVVWALGLPALWPLALSVGAAVWLMRGQPLVPHVEYFSADEDGLRYLHPSGQAESYKWTELRTVSAALKRDGAPAPCLTLYTGRGAMRGASVDLAMQSDADCVAAQQAAEDWLSVYRL